MDNTTIFETWSNAGPWTPWVKPMLFLGNMTDGNGERTAEPAPEVELPVVPAAASREAIVLDLPGVQSVAVGLALAAQGYRPIPLFNACPAPRGLRQRALTAVDVAPIARALAEGAAQLKSHVWRDDAPPIFLLDVNRSGLGHPIAPGTFDNRSVVFGSDFPSAHLLRRHGLRAARAIHHGKRPVGTDLLNALAHWRREGLPVEVCQPNGELIPTTWPSGGFVREILFRLSAFFTFHRSVTGGYGGFVPESSGG